jgi:TonB-linked SusC/RagA family outer membrane protein
MKKTLIYPLLLLLLSAQLGFAQGRVISGNVSDEQGPLPGAAVIIKGSTTGALADFDGNYSIEAKTGDVLVFSFVGMKTKEVNVGASSTINVVLESSNLLEEVVVVAYGTSRKESFTGSVTQINSEDIGKRTFTNVINALDGAAAGVKVAPANGQPGSSPTIRVRGIGSINASSDPLIVLDGVEFVGSFSSLNQNDIESITVLKDAASTSLYGSRAANGIILITSKKGRKGRDIITLNVSQGVTDRSIEEYERVNAFEYYPLMWEAIRNGLAVSGNTPMDEANATASATVFNQLRTNPFNVPNDQIVGIDGQLNPNAELKFTDLDWQDELERTGTRSNYDFSYSGANDKTDYFVSLNYLLEEGFVIKSNFERVTARVNINSQLKSWLKTGLNLSGATSRSNNARDGGSNSLVNPFFTTRTIAPIYSVFLHDETGAFILDDNGKRIFDDGGETRVGSSSGRHVIQETLLNISRQEINSISARTYAEISFLKDFTFTVNGSLDKRFLYLEDFDNPIVGDGAPIGRASRDSQINTTINFNQLLRYNKTLFDDHNVSVLLGHENFETEVNFLTGFRSGQIVDGNTELINFTTTLDSDSNSATLTREGYFANLTYDYKGKYFLSGSFRRDASSRFSRSARWGNFFSVGAAWSIDKERFLENVDWINALKLRASYGEVGNDNLGNFFISQPLFGLGFNNGSEGGIRGSSAGNPDLTWEKNVQQDIALEFSILNSRVSGTIEYYDRDSQDLLFEVPLPVSSGFDSFPDNIGDMTNRGLEFDLNIGIIRNANFRWDLNINASTIENEITRLPQEEIITGTKKLVVGGDIFDFWLRDWYGVDPADGSALFVLDTELGSVGDADVRTINGVDVTTNQNKAKFDFLGTATPDLFGAFTNNFKYKQFDLGFTFTYQIGGKTFDSNYQQLMSSGTFGTALSKDILKRWRQPGDITDVPRMDAQQVNVFSAASDRWLIDSDFLALRQFNVGYTLTPELASSLAINTARIYVSGENLFVASGRKGLDAGQNFNGTTQNRFTPSRTISLGLNLTF